MAAALPLPARSSTGEENTWGNAHAPETFSPVRRFAGWLVYFWALALLAEQVPDSPLNTGQVNLLLLVGTIGIWRYSLGITHFLRSQIFVRLVYPQHRRAAQRLGDAGMPPHVYIMVTSFRIEASTTAAVYRAAIREAAACGIPATVVASIVEMADERLILGLWESLAPPPSVMLRIVRIAGTGKRDGLAQGFRAISRDMPADDAAVAVVDGDTVIHPGVIRQTAPFLKLFPRVGGLTTNEFCEVDGGVVMREWHRLRFAQRHLNMCSMALSQRVLTLTGRMSVFRACVITDPLFIADVENDSLNHWRLGRFKFLTGDDKSSWYSLMRLGWDTYYVPDATINTLEHPPDPNFFRASRQLMFRWYGNSLRQNSRATRLGPARLGWFTWYVLWDQRVSMWTSLLGLTAAIVCSVKYGAMAMLAYIVWVGISRLYMTAILLASGHRVGPMFPVLLYYNQVVGSLVKIYVFFHLDQQSWTRQKTKLDRGLGTFQRWFNRISSDVLMVAAGSTFFAFVLQLV
jgi:glycosyltransferase Alg8